MTGYILAGIVKREASATHSGSLPFFWATPGLEQNLFD